MGLSTIGKNQALDGLLVDAIRLHSGDPGASGTSNALGSGLSAAVFNAASAGARALNANVDVTGLATNQSVTYFSVWKTAGAVFLGSASLSGDIAANAAGTFRLATGTQITAS